MIVSVYNINVSFFAHNIFVLRNISSEIPKDIKRSVGITDLMMPKKCREKDSP